MGSVHREGEQDISGRALLDSDVTGVIGELAEIHFPGFDPTIGYLLALTKLSRGYAYVTSSPLGSGTAPVLA